MKREPWPIDDWIMCHSRNLPIAESYWIFTSARSKESGKCVPAHLPGSMYKIWAYCRA